MARKIVKMIAWGIVALVAVLAAAGQGQAQNAKTPDGVIASIDQYLMDRNAEIAMARTAAPEAISGDAEVLVLGRQGYETAVQGKNGFVCVVQRSWTAACDDPEFGSPKLQYPICFNAPAARSYLPIVFKKTELALARPSKDQMLVSIKAAFDKKELPAPEPGSMCYMMSQKAYYGKLYGRGAPHLMFFVPPTDGMAWGAVTGSPVMAHQDVEDRLTVFVVPVGKWSDGMAAPADMR